MNHIKLGKLIRKVDGNKNKQLKDLPLLGINIDKEFMPSVANTIGTDMSNYQIVKMKQFACNPMHLGRDERMPTALLLNQDEILVSPAYFVFEVIDKNVILPEYLMLYFKQPETDRLLWFKTDSSVRGGLGWNELCDIEIPVPDLQVQKDIIRQYNQISDAIKIKEKLNNNLEEQIDIFYNNIFDNESDFVELRSAIETTSGGTPSRNNIDFYTNGTYNWIKSKELLGTYIFETEEKITELAIKKSSAKPIPQNSVLVAMYGATVGEFGITVGETTCNQAICALIPNKNYPYSYIFWYIRTSKDKLKIMASGSAQQNISQVLIKQLMVHSNIEKITKFDKCARIVMAKLLNIQKEIKGLKNLKDALLPKLMLENCDSSSDKLSFI